MELKRLSGLLRFWPWLAAISSGLLYTGCFAPFNFTGLCWFALTPLIAAIWFSDSVWRHLWLRNLLLGYVTGLIFFWTAFFWLTTVTVLGWFVLQFYMAVYFALWAWFCGCSSREEKDGSQAQLNGNGCWPRHVAPQPRRDRHGQNRQIICCSPSFSLLRG